MFFLNRKTGKELKNKIGQHNLHQLKHNNDPPCTESSQKIFLCFFKKFSELVCSLPNRTLDLDLWRQIWFQHERWHKKKAQESPVIPSQEKRRFSTVPCRWAAQTLVLNTAETDAMQRWKKKKKTSHTKTICVSEARSATTSPRQRWVDHKVPNTGRCFQFKHPSNRARN